MKAVLRIVNLLWYGLSKKLVYVVGRSTDLNGLFGSCSSLPVPFIVLKGESSDLLDSYFTITEYSFLISKKNTCFNQRCLNRIMDLRFSTGDTVYLVSIAVSDSSFLDKLKHFIQSISRNGTSTVCIPENLDHFKPLFSTNFSTLFFLKRNTNAVCLFFR